MPYYDEIKTLLIHIPKTGGSSLEEHLKKKYDERLYSKEGGNKILPDILLQKISLQHLPYNIIYEYRDLLNINFNNELKVISIVRNPYNRVVSDLLWWKLIDKKSDKNYVYNVLSKYIYVKYMDNHNVPQYKFLVDENDNLIDNIKIFKTETLTKELQEYGFKYVGMGSSRNYFDYLNSESIKLINEFYKKDFELFNYDMII